MEQPFYRRISGVRVNKKIYKHPTIKIVNILISTVIITAVLVFVSQTFAQKNKEDVEATDFVLDLITLYLNVGEIDEAINALEKLRNLYPEDYDVQLYLGIAHFRKQDYDSAFKVFREIEKILARFGTVKTRGRFYLAFSSKNEGLLYFGRGITLLIVKTDFNAAKKRFIWALKEGYDEINVRYLLIYSYLKLKNYKKADKELNEFLKEKEVNEKDYFLKGYSSYYRGLRNEAISSFKKALEINPNLKEAKKNLACIYYNNGEYEKAIEMWRLILEENPEDSESMLNTARAYFYLGRLEEAKQQFESLNISLPVEDYSPKRVPLNIISWKDWIKFNIKYQVDYEALLEQKNLENLKKKGVGTRRFAAIYLNERALFILRKEGNVEKAIKILNLANVADETAFFVNYNLGQLYLNSGNMKKAEECALKAIQNRENFFEAHDFLGNIYFKQGKYKNALQEFKRVIKIYEFDAPGHYNMGCVYWELQDWKNAEKEWKKAVEYDAPIVKKEKDQKYTRDGWSFSLIVREKPVAYRAHISLGSLYEKKSLIEDAIREFERAVKREPDIPEAYFELGRIYFEKKSWEKAKFYLEKHISLRGQKQEKAKELLKSLRKRKHEDN